MRSAGPLSSSGTCWEAHMAQHSSQLCWVTALHRDPPGHPCTSFLLPPPTAKVPYVSHCNLAGKSGRGHCWLTFWSVQGPHQGVLLGVWEHAQDFPCTPR